MLCYDTGSVICSSKAGESEIEMGNYLGESTNEFNSDEWITNFCSTGPKCYAYQMNQNREVLHVKGFSTKGEEKHKVLFDTIRSCIDDRQQKICIK